MIIGTLLAVGSWGRVDAASAKIPISAKPANGMVASYQRLDSRFLPAGVTMYQIEYWSQNVKVEALLTEPSKPGAYPLLVNLHGGYPFGHPHDNFGYTPPMAAEIASASAIELYPEYQGYLGSPGPTAGVHTDFINIQDAMKIAGEFGDVKTHDTYVIGYSLGGGLALMTAGWDHQVRAVVAVSPWVGMRDWIAWIWAHPNTAINEISYSWPEVVYIRSHYGTNLLSPWYAQRSPNPAQIQAPVLLLQGTGDHRVLWQTVTLFDQQMKQDHRTVTLILYPGGHHGLHHKYARASGRAIAQWFKRYGLNFRR